MTLSSAISYSPISFPPAHHFITLSVLLCLCDVYVYKCVSVCVNGRVLLSPPCHKIHCMHAYFLFFVFFFFCIKISSIKHSLFFISLLSRPKAAAYAFRNRLTPIRISVCMEICMCICIVFVCA